MNQKSRYDKAVSFYSISMLLLPILFQYSTGVSTITIGDVLLFISLIYLVIAQKGKIIIKPILVLFIIYILIQTLFIKNEVLFTLNTTLRFSFYIICCGLLFSLKIDSNVIIKYYKAICILVTTIIIIQTIAYRVFGIVIPGVLQFLKLTDESLYNYEYALYHTNSQRCMSVFGEPSHFALYVLPCALICLLGSERLSKKNVLQAGFIILGILVSTTFTGLLGLFAVILIWLYYYWKNKRIKARTFIVIMLLGILGLLFYQNSFVGRYLADGAIYQRQSFGRFDGYTYIAELKSSTIELLLGHGMNDTGRSKGVYLAGWARMIYYYGFIGSFIYVWTLLAFRKKHSLSLGVMLLLFVLSIGTEVNFSPFLVVYILLVQAADTYKESG